MSCLDRNVRNQPACRAEARSASRSKTRVRVRGALATGGWEPTGAWCLWTCTLVIDPLSWERRVGEKETEDLMLESIERASGWVVARRRRRFVTCRPSCLHKDWVLRLRFASPQNIEIRECSQYARECKARQHPQLRHLQPVAQRIKALPRYLE